MLLHILCVIVGMMMSASGGFGGNFVEVPVELDGLYGTLTLPDGDAAVPVALILAGSGPVDRNGNMPGMVNNSLRLLAEGLASEGVGSLRIDKRGIGQSFAEGMVEDTLRLSTYVDDAVSWTRWLASHPRVQALFVIGHSEGALIGTLAAQVCHYNGIILLAGAGESAGNILSRQLRSSNMPEPLLHDAEAIMQKLATGREVAEIPASLQPLFRRSVQPYLISWFTIDPAAELAKTSEPALVVQGTNDIQISLRDAELLSEARSGVEKMIIDGMNHILKNTSAGRSANIATYAIPNLPLAEGLVATLTAFMRRASLSRVKKARC